MKNYIWLLVKTDFFVLSILAVIAMLICSWFAFGIYDVTRYGVVSHPPIGLLILSMSFLLGAFYIIGLNIYRIIIALRHVKKVSEND
jgi:hypothetical protein